MSMSTHESRRRSARKLASRIAEDARRKRGKRYQEGGALTDADEDVAKSQVPDAPPPQAEQIEQPQVVQGREDEHGSLVYGGEEDAQSPDQVEAQPQVLPIADRQVAPMYPVEGRLGVTSTDPSGRPYAQASGPQGQPPGPRIGPGGYQYQTPNQLYNRFHNPLFYLGRAIAAWHEGTGAALVNAQRLEQGEMDLENHRQFYDRAYKYGSDYDQAMEGINGELDMMRNNAQAALPERDLPAGAAGPSGGAQGQGAQLGQGQGAGAAGAAPQGAASLANRTVPPEYQAQQARMNALDTATRAAIGNLAVNGDPKTAAAGAGLYTSFMNGQVNRQIAMANIAMLQQQMAYERTRQESLSRLGGYGQAPPVGATPGQVPQRPPQGVGPQTQAELTHQYQTEPPTTTVQQPPSGQGAAAPVTPPSVAVGAPPPAAPPASQREAQRLAGQATPDVIRDPTSGQQIPAPQAVDPMTGINIFDPRWGAATALHLQANPRMAPGEHALGQWMSQQSTNLARTGVYMGVDGQPHQWPGYAQAKAHQYYDPNTGTWQFGPPPGGGRGAGAGAPGVPAQRQAGVGQSTRVWVGDG
jgi:hypothetical protein